VEAMEEKCNLALTPLLNRSLTSRLATSLPWRRRYSSFRSTASPCHGTATAGWAQSLRSCHCAGVMCCVDYLTVGI